MRLLLRWWRHRLAREIGIALAIKVLLLIALWLAFFDNRPAVDPDAVGAVLMGTSARDAHGGTP
jgi:hypothetical protein